MCSVIGMEAQGKKKKRNKSSGVKPSPGERVGPSDDAVGLEGRADDLGAKKQPPMTAEERSIPPPPPPSSSLPEAENKKTNKRRNRRGGAGAAGTAGDNREKGEGDFDSNRVSMERDAEYRRLNAKIKEQEYRMRQMELNKKSNRDLSDQIAKKVEEEVRQKLSKAMIMSTMYKTAEEDSSPSRSSESLTGGKRGGKKKGERNPDSESRGAQKPSELQNPRSHLRLPKDAAPFRQQHPSTNCVSEEPSEIEVQQQKMESKAKEKVRIFLQLESEVKKRIDEIRRDKSALQDFCLLGPSNGAPEYALKCHEFESLILDKLSRGDPIEACQEQYCHKLTEIKLKQLGLFHAVLSSAMNSPARTAKESLITQIIAVFQSEISKAENVFTTALQQLQDIFHQARMAKICLLFTNQLSGGESSVDGVILSDPQEEAVRSSLANLLSSIGELRKYEISIKQFQNQPADWSPAITSYKDAIFLSPLDGIFYRPLAQISSSQGDYFQAAYYLSLSLMTDHPLATARETLLELFENCRTQAEQFPVVTALTRMSQQEHVSHFQPHFLAAVGIAYSRTSADMFTHHMERCRRHLSTILQLLTIDILHDLESGRGHKGDFTQYDQFGLLSGKSDLNTSSTSALGNENFFLKASQLSELIRSTLVIIISLLESLSNKHQLKEFYQCVNWNESYITNGTSKLSGSRHPVKTQDLAFPLSLEEKLVYEKRYAIQCLHKVQSIPGFLDLARLLLGLIATLISSEGVGIGSRTGVSSQVAENKLVSTILLVTTSPGISLFFDWISEHPEFQILSVLDKTAWEQMESDLAVYLSTLSQWTQAKTISLQRASPELQGANQFEINAKECLLDEDFVLQGFLPLLPLFQRRSEQFQKFFITLPHVAESLNKFQLLKTNEEATAIDSNTLSELLHPHSLLSSISHTTRLVVYAHRCVSIVRILCSQPVIFGQDARGIFFDRYRQTIYPSSLDSKFDQFVLSDAEFLQPDPKQCLCVIVYKSPLTMRSTGFLSSGHGSKQSIILTEEEFLQGSYQRTEELLVPDSEPSNSSEQPQPLREVTEDLANLKTDDTGEIFPEDCKQFEDQEKKEQVAQMPPMTQGDQQGKGVLRISAPSSMKRTIPNPQPPPQKGNSSFTSKQSKQTAELPLIVIDTPNVAMRHGLNTKFSCRGIKLAIDFFHSAGHRVVAFLPDFYFNFERVGELRRSANLGISSVYNFLADFPHALQLLGQGFLIGTPAQDYDDSYCLNYARQRGGYIISNDLYRDHLKRYDSPAEREETRKWLKSHVISYTFVGDEFLPNPDASMK